MIRISLGNVGSGKTACEVREMLVTRHLKRLTYSNIVMKQPELMPHVRLLRAEHIILKVQMGEKKTRSGTVAVYDYKMNSGFWRGLTEPVNVVLDEAHTILNARRAVSKTNVVVTDWIALIRRVLGGTESGQGELVLISQLHNRVDPIARDMANQVRYHVCHYVKRCMRCGTRWPETSEDAEPRQWCPRCGHAVIRKGAHRVQVWHFQSMQHYLQWKLLGAQSYHRCYFVNDLEKMVFHLYSTLQWENMFSEMY